jgi:Holliday junction DNA helicase RuvA
LIWRLKGRILDKGPSHVVIDVQGVGLLVRTPVSSFDRLGRKGEEAEILTHLHVRDDSLDLYGFADEKERRLFRMLLTVSGIGPRSALGILSGMNVEALESAILGGDVPTLTRVPGVGKKTAQRIIVELRGPLSSASDLFPTTGSAGDRLGSAVDALVALGLRRGEAYRSAARVAQASGPQATTEEIVRAVLAESSGPVRSPEKAEVPE